MTSGTSRRAWLAGAAASASALALAAPARGQSTTTLRIATTPIDTGGQVYYGTDMGFFKEAGFDVEISSINSGSAIATGVVAGTFDFAQVNIVSLAQARERNIKFILTAPGGLMTDKAITSALVVAKSSPVTKAKDLNGKTIAINALASIQQLGVAAWMDKNGGDSSTVKFIELPVSQLVASLVANRIDMALVPEPELDLVEHGTDARILAPAYTSIAPVFMLSAWVTSAQYAHDHPDIVKRVAAVFAKTARWANAHHAETAPMLTKYTKVALTPTMARVQYAESFDPAHMNPVLDTALRYGLLKTPATAADLLSK
jgi:NitT/TauT family transport system substrate-binding protein